MNLFTHLRTNIPILSVVQEYTNLKPAGTYWKGNCPFHQERTGSFTVSPHKDIFYCFGCHAKGDVIAFLALIERCTQFEAAKMLAERYSIDIEKFLHDIPEQDSTAHQRRTRFFTLMELVRDWTHQQLTLNPTAQAYLEERKLTPQSIDRYQLGYFPRLSTGIKSLQQALARQNFALKDLLDLHILLEGQRGLYSPFEERIIFPIHDHLGHTVALGGRTYMPGDERAKYYNSREHEFFTKGTILYGLDLAKKDIQEHNAVILVEGYTDCIAVAQSGIPNVVATLGTAVTPEHLKILARHVEQLYVTFDGDNAGQQAMVRLAHLCWDAGIEMNVVELPAQTDPASFVLQGNDMRPKLESAKNIFSYFIAQQSKGFIGLPLKSKIGRVRAILEVVHTIKDPLTRDLVLQQAATELGLPITTLQTELARITPKQQAATPESPAITLSEPQITLSALDQEIAAALIANPEHATAILPEIVPFLADPVQQIIGMVQKDEKISSSAILKKLDHTAAASLHDINLSNAQSVDMGLIIRRALKLHWKSISAQIKQDIVQAQETGEFTAVEGLIKRLQALQQFMVSGGAHG